MAKANGIVRLISLIVTLVILLAGGVAGYTWLKSDVEVNTKDIVELKVNQGGIEEDVGEIKLELNSQGKDIEYILEGINEIKNELK